MPYTEASVSRGRKSLFILILLVSVLLLLLLSQAYASSQTIPDLQHRYAIALDLPQTTVYDLRVSLMVPKGLIYDGDGLRVTGVSTYPSQRVSYLNDGTQNVQVEWEFGDVGNSINKDITISFNLIVANVKGNYEGVVLGAVQAKATWKDFSGVIYSSSDISDIVKVIEPELDVKLTAPSKIAKPGAEVVYTILVNHNAESSSDGLDADIQVNVPKGLTYSAGSMEIVSGPPGTEDESNPRSLRWHFDRVSQLWGNAHQIQLRYKATIDKNMRSGDQLTSVADLGWYSVSEDNPEKRTYSKAAKHSIFIISNPPDFMISLADSPDPVNPGGNLRYTISYLNRGDFAFNTIIEANYDRNVSFISADPAPDAHTNNRWSLGDLGKNDSGSIKIVVQANSPESSMLSSSTKISCANGSSAESTATTRVSSTEPILLIDKFASAPMISPGNTLNYTISYSNDGAINANNVTVTDIIDKNLLFDPTDSTPMPSKVWTDEYGIHLWWSAEALNSEIFPPGCKGKIELRVTMPSVSASSSFDSVYNNYKIDSEETIGCFNRLETFVVHSLWIRKKADKKVYSTEDIVNYTILYGSEHDVRGDATNVGITDVLPDDMEFVGADPSPTDINGNTLFWKIGTIHDGKSGIINLYAKVIENVSEMTYKGSGYVTGEGFANVHQNLNAAMEPVHLTNFANITGYYIGLTDPNKWDVEIKNSSATILLADSTDVSIKGHGSGSYSREESAEMIQKNRSIRIKTSLSENYHPTSFFLPEGRSINYASKWAEAQKSKNRITGASLSEAYMYANKIERNSSLHVDKNGSTVISQTSFVGAGHIGILKRADTSDKFISKEVPIFESQEDYLGSFSVYTYADEYGRNVVSNRSVSGIGFASADKRLGRSQRSYESGTGVYKIKDTLETQTNYMAKEINVSYKPMNYTYTPYVNANFSNKWNEGIWSKSGILTAKGPNIQNSASLISEEIFQARYLKMNAFARGLNEMDTEAEFSGTAKFKVIKNSTSNIGKDEIALYDEYVGMYKVSRKTMVGGVARFDEPHLNIFKTGSIDPAEGTDIYYVITVTNDGNRALGPVYVWDYFPPGTEYKYSSLRPSQLTPSSAQWILASLGIGMSSKIELRLNMTRNMDNLVNRVLAKGSYNNQWIGAENSSTIELNWLHYCPPQILARKTGYVNATDPMLIHYNIVLKNREKYPMAASITDTLPEGIQFINSTVTPVDYRSDQVIWNITDIKPGEIRTIGYRARALHSGIFENQAHVETQSVNGSSFASADVSCSVAIKGEVCQSISSIWQPPRCFGLNCTQECSTIRWEEWIPCDNCQGAEEIQPLEAVCPCLSTSWGDDGYDIP